MSFKSNQIFLHVGVFFSVIRTFEAMNSNLICTVFFNFIRRASFVFLQPYGVPISVLTIRFFLMFGWQNDVGAFKCFFIEMGLLK